MSTPNSTLSPNIKVNVSGGEISDAEVNAYITQIQEKFPDKTLVEIDIKVDGEYADLRYYWESQTFTRTKRVGDWLVRE